jgi:hypothetical protein
MASKNIRKSPLDNHFSRLSIEDCSCSDEEHQPGSQVSCESCDTENSIPSCPSTEPEPRLSGDALNDAIETIAIIQVSQMFTAETPLVDHLKQIHDVFRAVQDIWRQAGAGGLPLIVASAVTNVACASLRELHTQLMELDAGVDLPSLHNTCGIPQGSSSIEYETGPSCDDQHQMLEDMHVSWKAIMHVKAGHSMPTGIACIHKPANLLDSAEFITMLTQGILHLIYSAAAPDTVIRNGTPVYADIGYLLSHLGETSNNLGSTFSLHLLSTSYKAYMAGLSSPAMLSRCRLSALKLSHQAQSSLSMVLSDKICFPCRCPETLSFHLDQLRDTLQRYTAYKCWDIFFQAPWVAGNHILEILDMCFYYGMRLIRYRHYVGSVLHSYNVLRQLAVMKEIPLLEHLCNFATLFFSGGQRPTNRFAASWARFVGARLKFKKGHKGHNHRESWCMAVPSHAAKRAAGFGINRDGKSQLAEDAGFNEIVDLKRMDYHVDDSKWDTVCGWEDIHTSEKGKRTSMSSARSAGSRYLPSHSTTTHSNHLLDLASYLSRSNKGPLPSCRLNLFAVFHTCVQIVRTISKSTHTDPKDKDLRCTCFATTILTGGDRIRDAEALGGVDCWRKMNGEKGVVEDVKRVICEVMGKVEVTDWEWDVEV